LEYEFTAEIGLAATEATGGERIRSPTSIIERLLALAFEVLCLNSDHRMAIKRSGRLYTNWVTAVGGPNLPLNLQGLSRNLKE
jgi:hypothetical protein